MIPLSELEKNMSLRGCLAWKFHRGQAKIEIAYQNSIQNNKSKLFVADCSRQLGKTVWLVTKFIENGIQKPKSRMRLGTAFLSDLEKLIMPAFDFVISELPKEIRPTYKTQKSTWLFPNESEIGLVGLDRKPDGLRGNRIDMFGLDEAGYISRLMYLYRYVMIPATTHVPDAKIIMTSTQPESPDHDFIRFCDRAESEGGYVKLDIFENPMLTKEQIDKIAEECGGYTSTAFRREYLCERIVEEERAIIPDFRPDAHIVSTKEGPYHHFWHRLEALDSGVRDMTACLFAYYDFSRTTVVIEDEFAIKGKEVTTKNISKLVKEKETALKYSKVFRRVADNDNLILIQDLGTEYDLYFSPTSKDELAAMVNKVRIWFSQNRIEINPRCVKLISALKAGIWNKKRTEFERSELHGHFDLIAALIYLVRNIPEHDNPIPTMYGVDLSNQVFFNKNKPSDSGMALKNVFFQK